MNVMQRLSAGLRKKKRTPARMTATHRLITRDSCVFLLSNFEFIKSRLLCTYMTEETKHHSSSCTNRKSAPVSSLCLNGYSLVHYWEWTNRCDEHLQWLMMMDKDVHYRQGWPHALTDIQSVPLPSMPPPLFFPSHQCVKAASSSLCHSPSFTHTVPLLLIQCYVEVMCSKEPILQ